MLAPFGLDAGAADHFALQKVLKEVEGKPEEPAVNAILLRSLMKARYDPQNLGHFGLAAEFYCHFTSPIRRYPDLMVHRVLTALLAGTLHGSSEGKLRTAVEKAAVQSSQRELADLLHVTPATIAISTKRMEKAGLLTKRVDEDNLRCKRLTITELGESKCDEAFEQFGRSNEELFKGFAEEELIQLQGYMDRMLRNLAEQLGEDPDKLDFATLAALVKAGEKRNEE